MERTAGLGHLSVDDWERLQEILDRFEKAWSNVASEDAIDLKAYLPGAEDPLRPVALQELIKADLEIRWRRGLTARARAIAFAAASVSPENQCTSDNSCSAGT